MLEALMAKFIFHQADRLNHKISDNLTEEESHSELMLSPFYGVVTVVDLFCSFALLGLTSSAWWVVRSFNPSSFSFFSLYCGHIRANKSAFKKAQSTSSPDIACTAPSSPEPVETQKENIYESISDIEMRNRVSLIGFSHIHGLTNSISSQPLKSVESSKDPGSLDVLEDGVIVELPTVLSENLSENGDFNAASDWEIVSLTKVLSVCSSTSSYKK